MLCYITRFKTAKLRVGTQWDQNCFISLVAKIFEPITMLWLAFSSRFCLNTVSWAADMTDTSQRYACNFYSCWNCLHSRCLLSVHLNGQKMWWNGFYFYTFYIVFVVCFLTYLEWYLWAFLLCIWHHSMRCRHLIFSCGCFVMYYLIIIIIIIIWSRWPLWFYLYILYVSLF